MRSMPYLMCCLIVLAGLATANEDKGAANEAVGACARYEQRLAQFLPARSGETVEALGGVPAAMKELNDLREDCRRERELRDAVRSEPQLLTLVAGNCTSSGNCCAHWTAGGTCAHEYPCAECQGPQPPESCHPSGMCCAHRTAGGGCAHEFPCPRCLQLAAKQAAAQGRYCSDGGQCNSGETCVNHECVSGSSCRVDADCGWQQHCQNGSCWLGNGGQCSSNWDCRFGNQCVNGRCEGPW